MREESADALHVLRVLVARGYSVGASVHRAVHTVMVSASTNPGRIDRYFDGGTLDACLLQIRLDEFPSRAA